MSRCQDSRRFDTLKPPRLIANNYKKKDEQMPQLDLDQVLDAVRRDDHTGICTNCGEEQYGCEPDARKYKCESCGQRTVFGAEELLITNWAF